MHLFDQNGSKKYKQKSKLEEPHVVDFIVTYRASTQYTLHPDNKHVGMFEMRR